MSTTTDADLPADLVERVMQLPPKARHALAALILDAPDDPEVVRREWNRVIADRIQGFLDGTIPARDWRESLAEVRRKLREQHPQ